jgi:HK97 family phage portal protein
MAVSLMDRFRGLFKYTPDQPVRKQELPFVTLFGYEKAYGAPQPQEFDRLILAYKSWAYACAWKNATSVAKVNLFLYKKTYDNKTETEEIKKIPQHPFLDVINSVNPHSNRFELMTITQINVELTGNAYWWMPKNVLGVPAMIWHIPSHWVKIVPSKTDFIAGYVVRVPGKNAAPIPFDESEIVHFKFPSPFDLYYGSGPTFAAAFGLDLNSEIKTWGINYFLNNAMPGGILTTENTISEDSFNRLRDQWNFKHRGTKNAGKIAILDQGLRYEQTGSNVRDARWELVSRDIRDEILAMYGVPASKLGLVEDVNRANADANDYTYQKETILPRLTLIQEKLNEKVIPKYVQDPGKTIYCEFESPIPADTQTKVQERQVNIQTGFSSIDEERQKEGLEPFDLPETSVPLISFGLVPAGEPRPDPNQMNNQDNAPPKSIHKSRKDQKWEVFVNATAPQERLFTNTMQRYFQSQHSEVMRNLNQYKSADGPVKKDLTAYILFNIREANDRLKTISAPHVRSAFVTGLTLGMKETGHAIDFNLFNPNITRAVDKRVGFFAEKINQSTADLIGSELKDGLEQGESINDISKRIDNIFNMSRDFRSKRIAQTEVIGATNDGQIRAYSEAGVEQKEWLTARDEKVRDSHRIDGQIVGIHDSFTTNEGTHLLYPGDRSAGQPPEEVINCRCTVAPIIR